MRLLGLLLILASQVAAQTAPAGSLAAARRGIDAGNARYIAAFKRADAEALAEVYDANGARLNEGGKVVQGHRAIAQEVGRFVQKVGPVQVALETAEV